MGLSWVCYSRPFYFCTSFTFFLMPWLFYRQRIICYFSWTIKVLAVVGGFFCFVFFYLSLSNGQLMALKLRFILLTTSHRGQKYPLNAFVFSLVSSSTVTARLH